MMPDRTALISNLINYCNGSPKRVAILKAVRKPNNYQQVAQIVNADAAYCSDTLNRMKALGAVETLSGQRGYFRQTQLMKTIHLESELRKSGRIPTTAKTSDSEIVRETVRIFDIEAGLDLLDIDPEIARDCFPLRKPFRTHAGEAYLTLENVMKRELGLPETAYGVDVSHEAKKRGVFNRSVPSETDGLVNLYNSAFLWYRNILHHRKDDVSKQEALKVILHADYLVKLFRKQKQLNNIP